ncbi:cubilin [Mytilus galloprovincialis]|uniref:Cubilin n=1 Tax=Mytilus galloprovincialis TaxID=29158 RepID=A0A8B6G0K0_MYTGA|nr:cubilin [Mytilus galloprovincialis]
MSNPLVGWQQLLLADLTKYGDERVLHLQKENLIEISKRCRNPFWKDVLLCFSIAKPNTENSVSDILSLDILNFSSLDDFPYYIQWKQGVIFLMLACERTLVEGLTCLNCDSVMNPLFCDHTIECMSGSICSIEKFESSGNILYKLGCLSRTRCPRTRSLGHTDIEQCIECCTSDGCNKDGCGITNHLQTGPLCFNCDGIADPTQCHQARVCEADEMCYIQEIMRFNQRFFKTSCENMHVCQALSGFVPAVGRKKRAAFKQKRSTLCSKCCQSDLCNDYCTTATSTTPVTTTTIFHVPCGGIFSSPAGSFSSPNHPGSYMFISFTSDHSQVDTGFAATYSIVEANTCGIFTEMSGNFSSPYYPGLYPNNKECKYIIDVPDGYVVVLHLYDIETESCCDHVSLGNYQYNKGSAGNQTIESTNSSMLVIFSSDSSNVDHGFFATYTTHSRGCGGNFSSMSGSFSSPWFPDPYPNLSNCKYYIDVPVGYRINLTVVVFRTESSLDYLEVYDGPTTSNNHALAKFSGTYENNTVYLTSTQNVMLLHFTSDVSVVYYGFRVSFKAFNDSGSRVLTSSTGSFSSPNYPHPYTDYLYCTYLIRVQSGQRINLSFSSIITEDKYDYIQVFDGSRVSDRRLLNFSGSINNASIIQSTGNVILVLFTTDGSNTERGFTATYTSHS